MAKTILYTASWWGIYEAIRQTWQFFEKMELGYVIETNTDSTICGILSLIFLIFLIACAEV